MRNTRVKLDEPSMCRHGLGTHETESSIMNHIDDMISIGMLTTETILNSRDDRTWDSVSGSCTTQMTREMYFLSGSLAYNLIKLNSNYLEHRLSPL